MKKLLFILLLFLVAGCESINESHQEYLSSLGWEIKASGEVKKYILDVPEEMLENYRASGVTFIEQYNGKEITRYEYKLKEKTVDNQHLMAYVYEYEEEIIGGSGSLPTHTPGTFNLENKERLVKEKLIKK